jgi:hypothetical protein
VWYGTAQRSTIQHNASHAQQRVAAAESAPAAESGSGASIDSQLTKERSESGPDLDFT